MEWVRALHVISVIAWMAGLFYLPRLFVYHAESTIGSAQSETFKVMERRLYRAITTPAMIASWVFGLTLVLGFRVIDWSMLWPWLKAALVLALSAYHGMLGGHLRTFARDGNQRSSRYFRLLNEVPTVIMVLVVLAVVVKPF